MALVMLKTPGRILLSMIRTFLRNFMVLFRQRLELYWQENDLGRKISFDFVRNRTDQLYGVERVNAVCETRRYKRAADSEIVTEFVSCSFFGLIFNSTTKVSMTTFLMEPWEFLIPIGSSYLCKDAGNKDFYTVLR